MKPSLFLLFLLVFVGNIAAQVEHPVQSHGEDYKQYLQLSYAEIDSLMYIEYNKGAFEKAILLMQAGREKSKIEFGEQDSIFAGYTSNLGFFYKQTGQYDKALPFSAQAINIYEKVLGREHPTFARTLNNLALLHKNMGNYDKALLLYTQTINIQEIVLGKEHPDFAQSLNNLASLHQNMGNYDKAMPLYMQAINIREKVLGKEHPLFAQSLNNLAYLHQSMGNYDMALPLYTQAINIRETVLGKEHPLFALSLNNLAGLHHEMGNYDMALSLFMQAKNIREKVLKKEHPLFAQSLNNLAGLYQEMSSYNKALPLFVQAKNIYEKVLGMEHPDFAQSLNNLALLHQSMGNYDKAWNLLGQAMNSSSGIILTHDFDRAWMDSLQEASYASNEHFENMVKSLQYAYSWLKQDSTIQNVTAKQIVVADLATALLTKQRNQVSNEQDKLRMLAQSNDWLIRSLTVFNPEQHSNKAFRLSNQNKSVLLLQATKSETAYRLGELPDSLVWEDKKLLKKQSQLQAKLLEKRSEEEKKQLLDELNHANQDIDDFIAWIKKDYPKYHKLKYQQVDAKVEEIQVLLDDNTALLEYVIGDSVVHIFYVDKQQVVWKKSYIFTKKLNEHIKSFHSVLSDYQLVIKEEKKSYDIYTEKAHWFYQNLIAPVLSKTPNSLGEKGKKDIKNLIIVSDGELGHLPFETFLVEQAPQSLTDYAALHYLVNDYNISYNYSATLWKENKESPAPKNNEQMLALAANYDIKLDSSMMEVRLPTDQSLRATLIPLLAARKEVETLQENYEGFFAFDALASEKTVKEKASEYAILHFATHGILDPQRPVLSSLAFTEDNDSIESNFWQAHEISKLQLNADLVVLSACETGYGKFEAGNGIASLARAFMYAGSPALIVSLWQVNDFATSEIMKNLYANLANGMKKDEALRQAKLQYMKEAKGVLAHPAFWSPFIMMGKTDAVSIKTKGNPMAWGIGIGGLALLGIGGFLIKRKNKDIA